MAEFLNPEKQNGKPTQKHKNIRIDMTPMVDLGFLLITFFMFAANFSKPNIMDLGLPAKSTDPTGNVIHERNSINFILGKDNRIFYHQKQIENLTAADLKETSLEGSEIVKVIAKAKKNAIDMEKFTVIIKPTEDSNYKNFVDMLDNMSITNSERYGITDLKPHEELLYKKLK